MTTDTSIFERVRTQTCDNRDKRCRCAPVRRYCVHTYALRAHRDRIYEHVFFSASCTAKLSI